MPPVESEQPVLSGDDVRAAARACGFPLVGLARAEPLDPGPLERWLKAGYAGEMGWMERNVADRLDPARVLPAARSVLALAIPFTARAPSAGPSPVTPAAATTTTRTATG